MAGLISRLLDPSRIILTLQSSKRTTALNELAHTLKAHEDMLNFDGFYQELLARDRLDTTCLGNGVAVPHARTEHVRNIIMAVGRSPQGIVFDNGHETVNLMFMLGTPKTKPGDYLQVVSALCRLLKDPANKQALMKAATPEAFMEALVAAENSVGVPVKC